MTSLDYTAIYEGCQSSFQQNQPDFLPIPAPYGQACQDNLTRNGRCPSCLAFGGGVTKAWQSEYALYLVQASNTTEKGGQ